MYLMYISRVLINEFFIVAFQAQDLSKLNRQFMCVGHKLIEFENLAYQQTFMLSSDINGECCRFR